MHDACCLCNTCTYPYTHACTRIHSDSPSPHIAETICYFSCYVHRVSNDSKTDTKCGRICDICIYLHAYATHTCASSQRFPCSILPLNDARTFSCCTISVLIADQLLCTFISVSCIILCLHIMLHLCIISCMHAV